MMDDETQAAIDLAVEGDEQLLREALEALGRMSASFKKLLSQVIAERGASDLQPENQADVVRAHAAITKLEQRLLEE